VPQEPEKPKKPSSKSKTIASVVLESKQKEDLRQTLLNAISYIVNLLSLFYISIKVLPSEKYSIDNNFRSNLNLADANQINDTWGFIKNELLPFDAVFLRGNYGNSVE